MKITKKKKIYKNVVFFYVVCNFRIRSEDKLKIERVVRNNQDLFDGDSHFFRCAVIRELRNYDEKGRKIRG